MVDIACLRDPNGPGNRILHFSTFLGGKFALWQTMWMMNSITDYCLFYYYQFDGMNNGHENTFDEFNEKLVFVFSVEASKHHVC